MKRKLHRWAYAAAGITIMIAAMVIVAPSDAPDDMSTPVSAQIEKDPLAQFILEQEQLRSMQLMQLDEIINSDKTTQELIDRAQAQKLDIVDRMETETTISCILRARGYRDAAAAYSGEFITIMVRAVQAEKTDIARITELVTGQTDLKAENIKIIPIN